MQGFVDRAAEGPQHRRTTDETVIGTDTRPGDAPELHPEEIIDAELEERRRAEAVAGPEPRVRTDGGEASDEDIRSAVDDTQLDIDDLEPLHVGDHVSPVDRETTTVVMRRCDDAAGDYWISEIDETIAEYHGCDPDEDVYQVVFAGRNDDDLADLQRYPYPRSKLALEEPLHDRDGDEGVRSDGGHGRPPAVDARRRER